MSPSVRSSIPIPIIKDHISSKANITFEQTFEKRNMNSDAETLQYLILHKMCDHVIKDMISVIMEDR